MAACISARPAPWPLAAGDTYMPITRALCRVLGLLENSSATVPVKRSPSKAPRARARPPGLPMRWIQKLSGSCARSAAVLVKASAACS